MIKPEFELSRWSSLGETMGGFHLGFYLDWETWVWEIGIDLGFWCIALRFPIPFSSERKERLLQKLAQE